jgi:signal transduction histidine kinase
VDVDTTARDRVAVAGVRRWPLGAVTEWLAPALAVALAYYLAAHLGFTFTLKPQPISTLWPPNALLLAVLLLAPARSWWWLLAAALPAHLAVELQSGVPTAMVLCWFVSNCSEALIGAALVRVFVPGPLRLDSLRTLGIFILGAGLAAPLLSSFLDAALVRLIGWGEGAYWDLVRSRFASNVLAELTVGPLILTWAALAPLRLRQVSATRCAEVAALFAGLILTTLAVFDRPLPDSYATPALFYAPLPFLLWAAVRLRPVGMASALATMTVMIIWGAVYGLGPFAELEPRDAARDMQLFLCAVTVPLLMLAVALEQSARVERDALEQRRQVAHLSRVAMLGELSGGIAHELNQPLTAILANAQAAQHLVARESAKPGELAEILQDIVAADRRAGDVIRRLHALFKRGETQFERLDINDVAREVLAIVRGEMVMRSIEVATQLGDDLPAVRGDRVELQQVLLNLVMNACEAMSAATPADARRLMVRTRADAGGVTVSVTDSGPGFVADEYEQLFEPFYTTKPQGLGLGLSISRAIIRAHRGRLWGTAFPGEGATFNILLPAYPSRA